MNPTINKVFKTSFFSTLGYFVLSGICMALGYSGFLSSVLQFPLLLAFGLAYAGVVEIFFSGILVFAAMWLVLFIIIVLCTFKIAKH